MPKFLTRDEIYSILNREQPEGVYAEGPATAFFTTAENDSVAKTLETLYSKMEQVYHNYFPKDSNEKISDWCYFVFGEYLPDTLTLEEKIDRVVTKLRSRKAITVQDIKDIVYQVIGSDKVISIVEWGNNSGTWFLGESLLGESTILGEFSGLEIGFGGEDLCEKTAADLGLTEEEFARYKETAYTYEVRIYGYTMTADEAAQLETLLNKYEPVRSRHLIYDGL